MEPLFSTKLTYEDYCLLPDDGKRYEIIDGELYASSAPNTKHQRVVGQLLVVLYGFVRSSRLGEVFMGRYDTVLSNIDVVQPDLIFISAARAHLITEANLQGAPDLVVEVLSPSNRGYDETLKRKRYAQFGVVEYWIVDPEEEWLRIHRRPESGLPSVAELRSGDVLTTPLLPGFSLPVELVFDL
jgi:Uma2 family endonuclease